MGTLVFNGLMRLGFGATNKNKSRSMHNVEKWPNVA